jgi:hypothetical protein
LLLAQSGEAVDTIVGLKQPHLAMVYRLTPVVAQIASGDEPSMVKVVDTCSYIERSVRSKKDDVRYNLGGVCNNTRPVPLDCVRATPSYQQAVPIFAWRCLHSRASEVGPRSAACRLSQRVKAEVANYCQSRDRQPPAVMALGEHNVGWVVVAAQSAQGAPSRVVRESCRVVWDLDLFDTT